MSKASRLARPSSVGAGSKLPSSRKEAPGGARARVVSVGEKLMRAGSDGTLTKQRALAAAAPPALQQADKQQPQMQSQTQTQSQSQAQTMDMVAQPKSRISPPKASALPQGSMHSEYWTTVMLLFHCDTGGHVFMSIFYFLGGRLALILQIVMSLYSNPTTQSVTHLQTHVQTRQKDKCARTHTFT